MVQYNLSKMVKYLNVDYECYSLNVPYFTQKNNSAFPIKDGPLFKIEFAFSPFIICYSSLSNSKISDNFIFLNRLI